MKNIHVLPTDKASNLLFEKISNRYYTNSRRKENTKNVQNQNIYITSDEKIKEGDWCIDDENSVLEVIEIEHTSGLARCVNFTYVLDSCKKIILTTDQDLIKDGVHAIDDEFLEWFIKNPSCESVEVEVSCGVCHSNDSECWRSKECSRGTYDDIYKTVISKEENIHDEYLKDDTLEVFINRCISSGKYIDGVLNLKQKQILEIEDILGRYNDSKAKTKIRKILESKQDTIDTLEYGLLQHIKMCLECNNESQAIRLLEKYGFEKQEGLYDEKEVELIANEMVNWAIDNVGNPNPQSGRKFDEVIAKFKKK